MPHHNRAILSEIAEQDLDPTSKLVVSKDGSLVESRKNKPITSFEPELEQKEEKQVKPAKPKKVEEETVVASLEPVMEPVVEKVVNVVEETLTAQPEAPAEVSSLDSLVDDALVAKKKKKSKVQS